MKKGIGAAMLMTIGLRLASMAGALDAASDFIRDISADGRLLTVSIAFELGAKPTGAEPESKPEEALETSGDDASVGGFAYVASPVIRQAQPKSDDIAEAPADVLPTTISGGLRLYNSTDFAPDIVALMNEPFELKLPSEGPQILIIHTHGSEAYTQDDIDKYELSDSFRTQDKNYNVMRVGDELKAELEKLGLNVIHDTEVYDYPSYTGSYSRSGATVQSYLEQHPGIAVVIDLHRDALGSGDVIYKTMANVRDESSAQIMMLVGTGENGLYHPYWQKNLKLALHFQAAVNQSYPTLARPIALVQERYNQQLSPGMMILEVGSSGNTLREALSAIRLFAKAVGGTLKGLVE